jgi:hypothetical protein
VLRDSRRVAGGAKLAEQSSQKLSVAWEKWRAGNGASRFEEFSSLVRSVLGVDGLDPVIGCAILVSPFFFATPLPLVPEALCSPAQEPKRYFTYNVWPQIEYAQKETVA